MITWNQVQQHLTVWFVEFLWRMFGVLGILALGLIAAVFVRVVFNPILRRCDSPRQRQTYFALRGILLLTVAVASAALVLVAFGVAGPVIGLVVTLGLALGFFADSLGGFRILLLRPFQVGDTLEIPSLGLRGIVAQITLTGIVLHTAGRAEVRVSNRKLFEDPIISHPGFDPGIDLAFRLDLGLAVEIGELQQQIRSLAEASPAFDPIHGCRVQVTRIESGFVRFEVRFFARRKAGEDPSSEFLKLAKAEFDRQGVRVRLLKPIKS